MFAARTVASVARICTAFVAAIVKVDVELARRENRRPERTHDLDAFRESGIARRRCPERAERAIDEPQRRARDVFRFHSVQCARASERGDFGEPWRKRQKQVQGVDRLGEEDTAAIAFERAPTRFVVVRLRPPPRDMNRCHGDVAKRALAQPPGEFARSGPKAMLKHDAELHARALAACDDGFCARRVGLERLFEQDVLARRGKAFDERQMGPRGRQDQRGVDRSVGDDRIEIPRQREIEPLGEARASLG